MKDEAWRILGRGAPTTRSLKNTPTDREEEKRVECEEEVKETVGVWKYSEVGGRRRFSAEIERNMGSEYQPLSSTGSCRSLFVETPECFICRDVELQASDPLRNFCDCKNLLAHHVCLSTWIQRGCGSEDRLRCIICKAKYQLQWSSPWRSVSFQWQTWGVLITVFALMSLVPYVVHCMMTAFTNPPPPGTFKVAAASFGVLTEILLIKCLSSYLSCRYRQAEQSSFTVRPRGSEEDGAGRSHWNRSEVTAAEAAGCASSSASANEVNMRKAEALQSVCLSLF